MGVRIDEAGHDQAGPVAEHLGLAVAPAKAVVVANGPNLAILDVDSTALEDHGRWPPATDEESAPHDLAHAVHTPCETHPSGVAPIIAECSGMDNEASHRQPLEVPDSGCLGRNVQLRWRR
jgi:hypothetical protein